MCQVWEVCPLLRPLLKLEEEKYKNLDSTLLSMHNVKHDPLFAE